MVALAPGRPRLAGAAGSDAEIADLYPEATAGVKEQRRLARSLARKGALREGLTETTATDIMWTIANRNTHHALEIGERRLGAGPVRRTASATPSPARCCQDRSETSRHKTRAASSPPTRRRPCTAGGSHAERESRIPAPPGASRARSTVLIASGSRTIQLTPERKPPTYCSDQGRHRSVSPARESANLAGSPELPNRCGLNTWPRRTHAFVVLARPRRSIVVWPWGSGRALRRVRMARELLIS